MARSKIERLDPRLKEAINGKIRDGHTIDDILAHVAALGADISRSSLGRYKQKMEAQLRRYREAQEVAGAWVRKLGEDPGSDVGRLIAEMLKTVAFQQLAEMGDRDAAAEPRDIMFLGKALKDIASADKLSLDREERLTKAALAAAAKAAESVARERGLSDDDAALIRAKILGVEL
jgi:hypothetical protein